MVKCCKNNRIVTLKCTDTKPLYLRSPIIMISGKKEKLMTFIGHHLIRVGQSRNYTGPIHFAPAAKSGVEN